MMNQEIQRDLQAQTTSKANAQNFLRLEQNYDTTQANAALTKQQAQQVHLLNANNYALGAAYDSFIKNANKMPPAQKEAQLQAAGMLLPYMNGKIQSNAAAVGAIHGMTSIMGTNNTLQDQQSGQGPVNYGKIKQLEQQSRMGVPNKPSESELGSMRDEAGYLEGTRALRGNLLNTFDSLNNMLLKGDIPGMSAKRQSYIDTAASEMANITHDSLEKTRDFLSSNLPDKANLPSTIRTKRRNIEKHFDTLDSKTPTMNLWNVKNAPPQSQSSNIPQQYVDYVNKNTNSLNPEIKRRVQFIKSRYGI